jgi:serine/threonine-protein kinase
MGEVYRARDTTLRREVAIKFVNPAVCGDEQSLLRLRHEALALAALNHPHVATLHELAEFDGFCGLVMELVGGETLAERIARGPLPVAEAIRVAAQIAAALEAAHERGLIHRDLKPANIKITADGTAKVLDFGIAKSEAADADATVGPHSTFVTGTGLVLGTAGYMSPEQARGRPVDRRTDIWALGCVLFEMLTARGPFEGPTGPDTLVAILEREPDWSLLPSNVPPVVWRLLRRCLEKEPRRRLRDAGDARLELEDATTPTVPVQSTGRVESWRSFRLPLVAMLALGLAAGALLIAFVSRPAEQRAGAEVRFAVALPPGERLGSTDYTALAISPDGGLVAFVAARGGGATTELVLRRLNELDGIPIPGTANAISPFFSPDSQWIGFFADGSLKKIPVNGGPPITLCAADEAFGGSWGIDDTIVFADATGSALSRVSAAGGAPSRATRLDAERGEFSHRWPQWLPDGKTILFTVGTVGEWDEAEIAAQVLGSDRHEIVIKGGTSPHYLPSGHLLYQHAGAMWIVPFDARRLQTTGQPARALDGVVGSVDGAAQFAVSPSGSAAYVAANAADTGRRLVTIDGADETPLAAPPRSYVAPRISPNGRQLLVGIADRTEHIWLYDLSAGTSKQLTFDAANRAPIWTPDGQQVTFSSNRDGALNLFVAPVDGSRAPQRLTTSDSMQLPGSWSPDGSTLAFVEQRPGSGRDIWLLRRTSPPAPWANSASDESSPRFSPDGRWIAYVSDMSGRADVFVRAPDTPPPGHQISREGGMEPVWARDGRALFYREGRRLLSVPVIGTDPFRVGPVREVFSGSAAAGTFDSANYDVLSGTGRFVMIAGAPPTSSAAAGFRVVVNWNPFLVPSP